MGNSNGPSSTIAGMPYSTLPSTMKVRMDTQKKVNAPPGSEPISSARSAEKPDGVRAQATAVAVPMISRMSRDRNAETLRQGYSRFTENGRETQMPMKNKKTKTKEEKT